MIPETLIILKNSIIEGKIPIPDNIEVGELALGLFKDSESIWAKNSSGEIINLRSPRHDLIWGNLLLSFDSKDQFESELLNDKIKDTCIVFIKNEKLIWSQGTYFNSSYSEDDILKILIDRTFLISSEIYELTKDSDSQSISNIFNNIWDKLINDILKSSFYLVYIESNLSTGKLLSNVTYDSSSKNLNIFWMDNQILYSIIVNKTDEGTYKVLEKIVTDLTQKQEKLVSGENIKTINGISLLGEGNINIEGGSGGGGKIYIGKETSTTNTNIDNELNTISVEVKEDAIDKLIPPEYVDQIFDEIFI